METWAKLMMWVQLVALLMSVLILTGDQRKGVVVIRMIGVGGNLALLVYGWQAGARLW